MPQITATHNSQLVHATTTAIPILEVFKSEVEKAQRISQQTMLGAGAWNRGPSEVQPNLPNDPTSCALHLLLILTRMSEVRTGNITVPQVYESSFNN